MGNFWQQIITSCSLFSNQFFPYSQLHIILKFNKNDSVPPYFIERLLRELEKHYGNLKTTGLKACLLFYALPWKAFCQSLT